MADLTPFQTQPATVAPFPAVQLANSFVERFAAGGAIDHLKLQKLTYFAYGWWLALAANQPPLSSDKPQVWKYGPVFHPIYNAFSSSGNNLISEKRPLGPFSGTHSIPNNDSYASRFVDWIWSRYGQYRGTDLSTMTHEVGTPWYETAREHDFVIPRFQAMSDNANRSYFRKLAVQEGYIQ